MLSLSPASQNKHLPKKNLPIRSQFPRIAKANDVIAQKRKSHALPETNSKKQKLNLFQCSETFDSRLPENDIRQKHSVNKDESVNKESFVNIDGLDASALKALDEIESPFFFIETFFDERTYKKFRIELLLSEDLTPNSYFALLSELDGFFQGPLSIESRKILEEIYIENYQYPTIIKNIYTLLRVYQRHLKNYPVHIVSIQTLMELNQIEYSKKYFHYHPELSIRKVNDQNLLLQAVLKEKIEFIQLFLKYGADTNKIPEGHLCSPEDFAALSQDKKIFQIFLSHRKA